MRQLEVHAEAAVRALGSAARCEVLIAASGPATAPGGGTSVDAVAYSGPLPYTGGVASNIAILGAAFLLLGAMSHLVAARLRRPAADTPA